jgi:hypothetical protein
MALGAALREQVVGRLLLLGELIAHEPLSLTYTDDPELGSARAGKDAQSCRDRDCPAAAPKDVSDGRE